MKHLKEKVMSLSLCLAVLLGFSAVGMAQDVVKLMPAMHKILLDNDDVRVYEATYKPGEKAAMHSHPKHVVYIISGGKITFTGKDGKKEERTMDTGQAIESPETVHMTENTGDTEVKVLVVELKHSMDHKMMQKKKM